MMADTIRLQAQRFDAQRSSEGSSQAPNRINCGNTKPSTKGQSDVIRCNEALITRDDELMTARSLSPRMQHGE
jgi:hypothetical protein